MHPFFKRTTILRARHKIPIFHRSFGSSPDKYAKFIEIYARDRASLSGQKLHARLIINGLVRLTHFASKLIIFYTECGQISNARKVFDKIPKSNKRRWIVLIGAYARCGFHQEAMGIFWEMQREVVRLSEFVIPSILKACGHLFDRQTGEKIHTLVLKNSFENDAFVISALIDMYSRCGRVERARKVHELMAIKDLVALNAMVSGYVQHGFVKEALCLVKRMKCSGLEPNLVTWNTLIAGFAQASDDVMIHEIIKFMRVKGIEPDVVSWTSIISGFVQNFQNDEAFDAFKQMLDHGLSPSSATISSILAACSTVADLRRGKELHGYALLVGVEQDVYVRSALVDMYAKCGFISKARILFDTMSERNTVTWNSMIFGYANHGYCEEAIELFRDMEKEEKRLDHLSFTAALTACSHAGMVEFGQTLFGSMREKYGIEYRLEHYACMVDILGRAGKLDEAYGLIQAMPMEPDSFVWGALLGACRNHGNIDLAEVAAKHLFKLEPKSAGSSLLLSNLYADAGSWGNAARMKTTIKKRKFKTFPGCSWIEAA